MTNFSLRNKRIWIAGHNGLVGSALCRRLAHEQCEVLTVDRATLDLRQQDAVQTWLETERPNAIILAAARVGGIKANQDFPADFLYDNLMIEANVIHGAYRSGVEKLLFLGSSCIYPRDAAQPIGEDALLTGSLEPTNEAYAIAKIAGIKLCQAYRTQHGCDFISAMPCNLYGRGDTYDVNSSHVIPALILKMHSAYVQRMTEVEIWGSGRPLREFLHSEDAADALIYLLQYYSDATPINIGSGVEVSIAALAKQIAQVVGFTGTLNFNLNQPDGVMRKLMNSERLRKMGWQPRIDLETGLRQSYDDYQLGLIHEYAA